MADSDSATFLVCILTVAIFACVSGQRISCLFLSFFLFFSLFPDEDYVGLLRQSTIAEKMLATEKECGREASGDEVEV